MSYKVGIVEKKDLVEDLIQPTLIVAIFSLLIIWWTPRTGTIGVTTKAVVGRPDGRIVSQRNLVLDCPST